MSGELKNKSDVEDYLENQLDGYDYFSKAWLEGFMIGCAASGIITEHEKDKLMLLLLRKRKVVNKL